MLTEARLKELLAYEPATGIFRWRVLRNSHGGKAQIGAAAGMVRSNDGYIAIGIDGKRYLAHRLAVLYMTGRFPSVTVDHVNQQQADNRWVNLREATQSENQANTRAHCDNQSGAKGVYYHRGTGKWAARLCRHGVTTALGLHPTVELAAAAYATAAQKVFGSFSRSV